MDRATWTSQRMVPLPSRHQPRNLYPSSDQNTQLSSPRHTQSPGIINKCFLSFCSFVFTRAHATQTGSSLYHCRWHWLSGLLVSVSPGLELHVCATTPGVCRAAAQTQGFVCPTRVLCQQSYMPSLRNSFSKTFYLGRRGAGLPSATSTGPYKNPILVPLIHTRTHQFPLSSNSVSVQSCLFAALSLARWVVISFTSRVFIYNNSIM